jgi:transcriptional regulator with XRE-family HTH domain
MSKSTKEFKAALGSAIRRARNRDQLSLAQLGERVGVTGATISNWELGRTQVDPAKLKQIEKVLGKLDSDDAADDGLSSFGAWLLAQRTKQELTINELATKAKVSWRTIWLLETGATQNPQPKTREALEKALQSALPEDLADELRDEQTIEGIGEMIDFDPHSDEDRPTVGGIYVFYDVSQRPIYVGEGQNIRKRIRDHQEKFWFKSPIVQSASYIQVEDVDMRKKVERILIKFLKSNAVINRQHVER